MAIIDRIEDLEYEVLCARRRFEHRELCGLIDAFTESAKNDAPMDMAALELAAAFIYDTPPRATLSRRTS